MAGDANNTDPQSTDSPTTLSDNTNPSALADITSIPSPTPHNNYKHFILLGLLALSLIFSVPYLWNLWTFYQTHESTDDAYVVGDIIPISSRISGTITEVMATENQRIEAGQLLAQLDQRDFMAKVQRAEAALAITIAQMRQAELEVIQEQG